MTKYYVDKDGKYVGGFDGSKPPTGSIEVLNAPNHASDTWDGGQWVQNNSISALAEIDDLESETNTARFQRELRNAPDTSYKNTGKTVAEYDAWAYSEIERLRGIL